MSNSNNKTAQNIQLSGLQKLDHFILGLDIALLGWTVVNTDWIPQHNVYVIWLVGIFWALIILSIIAGITRQIFIAEFQRFDDMHHDFQQNGNQENREKARKQMDFTDKIYRYFGLASIALLVIALMLLAGIKLFILL